MTKCHELRRPDGTMIAFLQERPSYCDRGRYHLVIEVPIFRSEADQDVRYYFDLEAGKNEALAYLKAKKVDVTDAEWICIDYAIEGKTGAAILASLDRK